jgi:hypothetical protein
LRQGDIVQDPRYVLYERGEFHRHCVRVSSSFNQGQGRLLTCRQLPRRAIRGVGWRVDDLARQPRSNLPRDQVQW